MLEQEDPDSPTGGSDYVQDPDDVPYHCMACGKILEEGKAYELSGHRWHIGCFRCNTCNALLGSDTNLLMLGDGSLICNNCTYSCSSCGEKIEELAILTGDQSFCQNCFKCRNCKKRIENLRYARTSQGIFCMDCHESLMARRRKKTARNTTPRQQKNQGIRLDKSLPSLPPSSEPVTVLRPDSPPEPIPDFLERHPVSKGDDLRVGTRRDHSRERRSSAEENVTLPSGVYNPNRQSSGSHGSDASQGEEFLIPVAFDPNTTEHNSVGNSETPKRVDNAEWENPNRNALSDSQWKRLAGQVVGPIELEGSPVEQPQLQAKNLARENQDNSNGVRGDILLDSIREQSITRNGSQRKPKPATPETFKLQDVPKGKRGGGRVDQPASGDVASSTYPAHLAELSEDTTRSNEARNYREGSRTLQEPGESEKTSVNNANPVTKLQYPPKRGDSLVGKLHQNIQRKEVSAGGSGAWSPLNQGDPRSDDNSPSGPSSSMLNPTNRASAKFSTSNRSSEESTPIASPSKATSTPSADGITLNEQFTSSHTTPHTSFDPRGVNNAHKELSSTNGTPQHQTGDPRPSPKLLQYSGGGDFSMDEDMARILGGNNMGSGTEDSQNHESFLRRVSNSVRHGRSFSDKGARLSKEHKWPKSPSTTTGNAPQDISSPSTSSPEQRDELSWFKNELRRERQKVIDKDKRILELESTLNATVSIKQVNTELREKRSTMVFLDAQKEIVLRELELLTEHIAAEKQSGAPLDFGKMTNTVLREFAESMQQLKESFAPQIEELIQKRNDLVEELGNLGRMKDKSFQEFEQLSIKNAQLAELNNQLVHQIQQLYKANSTSEINNRQASSNGLGIYSHQKEKSTGSADSRDLRSVVGNETPTPTSANMHLEEAEPVTVIQGPQVVSLRKGQARKFNWKRGGQNVAKGVTKGLKGAFTYNEPKAQRDAQFTETGPYGASTPQDGGYGGPRTQEQGRQGFGFFSNQKNKSVPWKFHGNDSSSALIDTASVTSSVGLFGSDLEQRIEVEKGVIPGIVSRCIEEVELRGMDVEGIYRKSGASSQVQMIREGFERSSDYDISDPDLDIHAVTSALKQYFRKLPTPLITYDVYDKVLDATSVTPVPSRVEAMQRSLQSLPRVHRDVLEFLIFHLKRVVEREKENLMTSQNVAVVFAPTILRPDNLSREMTDVQKKTEALQFLVDNCQDIFMGIGE